MLHLTTNDVKMTGFPNNFIWGVATASYQIEGAVAEGGRRPSVWDRFCQLPGKINNGDSGVVGPDHYHRWRDDVDLMAKLEVNAYRFSLAWPRIIPTGVGPINPLGIAFYDQLIDKLLEGGIKPWVTLFHWDYPNDLFNKGGWLHRDSSDWFAEYAEQAVKHFGDRIKHWITINEPNCIVHYGHQTGIHAPGLHLELQDVLTVAHNILLAHGKAVRALRSSTSPDTQIGIALNGLLSLPDTTNPKDVAAAQRATWAVDELNTWNNSWWSDPLFRGHYPEDGWRLMAAVRPDIKPGDMEIISQPLDFFGVNIYTADRVRATANSWEKLPPAVGCARTAMDWTIEPEALYWGPKFIYERYHLPLVILENGLANNDWIHSEGKVPDPQRIDFLRRYLGQLSRAIQTGVEVEGYFQWSLLDNFEWSEGFSKRFGLVYLDYATGQRIPKDSFFWYQNIIASNGKSLKVV